MIGLCGVLLASRASAGDGLPTHAALATYMVAAFTDLSTTEHAIGAGKAHEANPAFRWAVDRGPVVAAVVKGSIHTAMAGWLLHDHAAHPTRTFWLALMLTTAQVAVDVHNVRAVRR